MKKTIAMVLSLILLIPCVWVNTAMAEDALPTGYVLTANSGTVLADKDNRIEFGTENASEGSYSLKIKPFGVPSNQILYLNNSFNYAPEGEYRFSVDIYGTPQSSLGISFKIYSAAGKLSDHKAKYFDGDSEVTKTAVEGKDGWNTYSWKLTGIPNRVAMEIYENTSLAYVDNIKVEYTATGENYLKNGSFENFGTTDIEETDKTRITPDRLYCSEKPIKELPLTIETRIKIPESRKTAPGVIYSNWWATEVPYLTFEIIDGGVPKIIVMDENQLNYELTFTKVNVCTGETVHLAIAIDRDRSMAYAYVNGVRSNVLFNVRYPANVKFGQSMCLGGDLRRQNTSYFNGEIEDFAVYNKYKLREEIVADMNAQYPDSDGLMGYWKLQKDEDGNLPDYVKDISSYKNDLYAVDGRQWIDSDYPVRDYDYSIAVVGDTQSLNYYHADKFHKVYDWILNNVEDKNIKFVVGLGDITEKDADSEWELAKSHITRMDGVVPYSLVRGNHDTVAQMDKHFPYSEFGDNVDGAFGESMANTYQYLTVGEIDYLILNLDYNPSAEVVSWASGVVKDHPNHNVIIATHGYLNRNGTIRFEGANIWEQVAKKYENVVLVLCGHHRSDRIITVKTRGEKGNTVTQMLINPQDIDGFYSDGTGAGMVAMLYFSEDGKNIQVRYYSTIKEAYLLHGNQFDTYIDVVGEPRIKAVGSNGTYTVSFDGVDSGMLVAILSDKTGTPVEYKLYKAEDFSPDGKVTVSFSTSTEKSEAKFMWIKPANLKPIAKPLQVETE